MRNTARWAATLGLAAAAICGPLTGASVASQSAADSLYAPSALVLTFGHGENATTVAPERAVTLNCAPGASGTHPAATQACAELRGAGGNFDALTPKDGATCTREYNPVLVTAQGVWQGKRVTYERTFGNECVKNAYVGSVFAF